jgi:acetyltransferase-like isoleucine patch superfamily enzyme
MKSGDPKMTEFSAELRKGRRLRRFMNQIFTFIAMFGPGSSFRIWANRVKGAKIGKGCWIGDGVTIDIHYSHPNFKNSLILEDRVAIGPGVRVFTHDTSSAQITRGKIPVKFGYTSIGHDSWIGAGSTIANCKIGCHCIVAPNSLVTKNVPDYSLVMGVPSRVIKSIKHRVDTAKVDLDNV